MRAANLLENRGKQYLAFSLLVPEFRVEKVLVPFFRAEAQVRAKEIVLASFPFFVEYQISQVSSVQSFLFVSVQGIFRVPIKKISDTRFRVLRIQLWI